MVEHYSQVAGNFILRPPQNICDRTFDFTQDAKLDAAADAPGTDRWRISSGTS
jgi:hypothetical protein